MYRASLVELANVSHCEMLSVTVQKDCLQLRKPNNILCSPGLGFENTPIPQWAVMRAVNSSQSMVVETRQPWKITAGE